MKNNFYTFALIFWLSVAVAACKKSNDGGQTTNSSTENFQPNTAGSTWSYSAVSSSSGTAAYTLTATSKDTVVNGISYKVFTNSAGPNEYYNKTGVNYNRFSYFEALGQYVELLYMKDNLKVGDSWRQTKSATINGVTGTAELECVVTEKGISYAVGGNTFNGVTHIKINPTFYGGGLKLTNNKANIDYYFANGIGFIYSNTDISVSIPLSDPYVFTGTVTLTAYNIK